MLLILFVISVLVHEAGHFAVARLMHVRVSKFCIFYDPGFHLFSTGKRFSTEICIGWLPLGGYVKFADVGPDEVPPSWHIKAQKPLRRIAISLAGVASNFVVAYISLLFFCINFVAPADKHYPLTTHIEATHYIMKRIVSAQTENAKSYFGLPSHPAESASSQSAEEPRYYRSNVITLVRTQLPVQMKSLLFTFVSLNLMLVLFNLIPILPLDGGQCLAALYEGIFRRPPNEFMLAIFTILGMVALLALFIGDFIHDLFYFIL